jgi:hypothetical protein
MRDRENAVTHWPHRLKEGGHRSVDRSGEAPLGSRYLQDVVTHGPHRLKDRVPNSVDQYPHIPPNQRREPECDPMHAFISRQYPEDQKSNPTISLNDAS